MLKVSIIIPIYKVEPYIEYCITSVLRQTYRNLEVILVDDCTPDRSMEIAKTIIDEKQKQNGGMSFVFLKHDHNFGLSAARNTGIDAATGDYLFFLDSDDEITDDCIETLVRETEEGAYDIVWSNFKRAGIIRDLPQVNQQGEFISHDRNEIVSHFTNEHLYVMAWNKLVRHELITSKSLYFKEGIIHEDEVWSLLLANQAASMRIISDITYTHLLREGSIMQANSKRRSFESKIVVLKYFQELIQKGAIKDFSDNTRYMMEKRKSWMRDIFDSNELSRKEKIKYLFSIFGLDNSIKFTLAFLYHRIREKLAKEYHDFLIDYYPKKWIDKTWVWQFGHKIDWNNPKDINEKIQWLICYGDTSKWPDLTDKYKVREFIKEKGYGHMLTKLYGVWKDASCIDFDALPDKFILKCNHDSGSCFIVDKTKGYDKEDIVKKLNMALGRKYGYCHCEPHYNKIKPLIVAEEFLEEKDNTLSTSLIDYKVWCFDGKPYSILVCLNRNKQGIDICLYDLDWNNQDDYLVFNSHFHHSEGISRPQHLEEMLEAAANLSKGFPIVRVDFYNINGRVCFGEMTFTSDSGRLTCFTQEYLEMLGKQCILPL